MNPKQAQITDNPLVTVVIPTYRRPVEYLSRAVQSVLRQTYPEIDLIVIDDSPADFPGRADIRRYMESVASDRVRYLRNERNLGGSLARNRGIEAARGGYITFLDDDDEYMERKVEKQVAFMAAGGYDLTFSNMIMYNARGRVVDYREYADIPAFDRESLLRYHLMKHLTGTPTFMFRADKLREIGGFEDAKMGQEFYLMLKSIERGLKIGYLPECDVKVYKHREGGITQGMNKILGENALYEMKKKYFPSLDAAAVRFINFRHWAVMAVAYRRNDMYGRMLGAGVKAFCASPADFAAQVTGFARRVLKNRRG